MRCFRTWALRLCGCLRRLGVEVDFPASQTCCGQPHFNSGYADDARALARHTIQTFSGPNKVVIPSGLCAAMVKLEYPKLFPDDSSWRRLRQRNWQREHMNCRTFSSTC